jgi:hypothetical protein
MLAYLKQPKNGGYLLSGGVSESELIVELSFLDQKAIAYSVPLVNPRMGC